MGAQRKFTRYRVDWVGRIVLPTGEICGIHIKDISKDGMQLFLRHAIPMASQVKIEFLVDYKNQKACLRVKGEVLNNEILSNNRGAFVDVAFNYVSQKDMHTLNNVLHYIGNPGS